MKDDWQQYQSVACARGSLLKKNLDSIVTPMKHVQPGILKEKHTGLRPPTTQMQLRQYPSLTIPNYAFSSPPRFAS